MVHLSSVERKESPDHVARDRMAELTLSLPDDIRDGTRVTTSVYGSRFAMEDLPRHEMPECEMPREVAYRMIKDELSLDGNPKMNLASFVTTYMEDEAEKLMADAFAKNFIDYEEYPQTADIQTRCVNMLARLFHAPDFSQTAIGTSTIGSSEAIMLGVLAMKRRWAAKINKAAATTTPTSPTALNPTMPPPDRRPNIVMSSAVQVCWEKAANYFDVEARYVDVERDRYVIDPEAAVARCDENTIGICLILGTTYTGEYEDVKKVNDLLVEKGLDVGIHVDAASGGFVAPFVVPELEWDFRLEKVVSINVSGHKYGMVYPGVGWVLFRSVEYLPSDLVFNINYLGADQATFTLNFSKGASQIIGQYYQLVRLGRHGYRCVMTNLTRTADYLSAALTRLGFIIMSKTHGRGLPVVAFRFADDEDFEDDDGEDGKGGLLRPKTFDEYALAHQLRARGWIVPAYTMAPKAESMKMLRVVVRNDLSKGRCDGLITDIKLCLGQLEEMEAMEVARQSKMIRRNSMARRVSHSYPRFSDEHSMQGTFGKTHAIC